MQKLILLICFFTILTASIKVKGIVVDSDSKQALIGANVILVKNQIQNALKSDVVILRNIANFSIHEISCCNSSPFFSIKILFHYIIIFFSG